MHAISGQDDARRRELGAFLRSAQHIAGVGSAEIADRCGITLDDYRRFQTNAPGVAVSPSLIAAVARALHLDAAATTYLFSLIIMEMPRMTPPRSTLRFPRAGSSTLQQLER